MSAKHDDDLMATLTDEEREAMADDALSDEDRAALAAVAGDTPPATDADADDSDDDEDDDEDEDDDDDEPGDGQPAEGAGAAPAEGQPAAEPPAEPPAEPAQADADDELPQYNATLPADYQQRVDGLTQRTAEIQQKFNDGEIDLAERDQELAKVQADREELLLIRARADSLRELNEQNARQQWNRQIASFMADAAKPEQGGIDYRKDPAKAQDLDEFVRTLANRPENADKPGPWFLAEAHKRVMALHGITAARPTPAQAKAAAVAARKPALSDVPTNLAGIPGSDGPGDVGDEFADIMSLEGQDYEDAIARMTPAQRQKFLQG